MPRKISFDPEALSSHSNYLRLGRVLGKFVEYLFVVGVEQGVQRIMAWEECSAVVANKIKMSECGSKHKLQRTVKVGHRK